MAVLLGSSTAPSAEVLAAGDKDGNGFWDAADLVVPTR
jgi:hypothetical protein